MPQLMQKHTEAVYRLWGQYNHPFVFDRNGNANPYMRPDRRVRPGHVKWWFHGFYPVYGRVIRRLAPTECYMHTKLFYEFGHKVQHNLNKYGPVVLIGGSFIYGYINLTEHITHKAWRGLRLGA
mmetsp:Transcript_46018/g.73722  ORF Transcript_46018/g.73722 Transcript_46018/m.73722 type:complete len:124 (-) Transcript_46018:243-614(-)